MHAWTIQIEGWRKLKSLFSSRPASEKSAIRNPEDLNCIPYIKTNVFSRLMGEEGEKVASFGTAVLIRHHGGRWEIRGGSPGDHAAAREWCSVFQHEASFPSTKSPLAAEQPKTSKPVHSRILIVDDDSVVRGSLAAVLEFEGYLVDEACNGMEAVTRAIENRPDLALLDLNMPNWDGWTTFSQLDRVTPLLPVIVITARPNQYEKAVRLGVDAFMEKPLNIPVLVRAIKRLSSEDEKRHMRRITNPAFVTQLLDGTDS